MIAEGKASEVYQIPEELLKHCDNEVKGEIWKVMVGCSKDSEIPQEWKYANLVTIFEK